MPLKKLGWMGIMCMVFLPVANVQSQNPLTSPLVWSISQGYDLKAEASFSYTSTLTTHGTADIQWTQGNGEFVSSFDVTSTEGTWPDAASNGSLIFYITSEGSSGTLKFERTAEGVFVTLDFPANDPQGTRMKFQVSNINPGNE